MPVIKEDYKGFVIQTLVMDFMKFFAIKRNVQCN